MLFYLQIQDLAIHFRLYKTVRGWFVALLESGFSHFPRLVCVCVWGGGGGIKASVLTKQPQLKQAKRF